MSDIDQLQGNPESPVHYHTHNGVDSPKIDASNIENLSIDTLVPSQTGNSGKFLSTNGLIVSWATVGKFGGTGVDGVLALTSGTTTIDVGGAKYYELNYTSISITGTGALAFTNPHAQGTVVVIKSQGIITITATAPCIDMSGMGGAGGVSKAGVASTTQNGNDGTLGASVLIQSNLGTAGLGTGAGTGGAKLIFNIVQLYNPIKFYDVFVGAGGGSGDITLAAASTGGSGAGGNGGGALIIECGGAWNFTTANGITVKAVAGSVGSINTGTGTAAGGGGGGGGYCRVLYNTLTANTGTIVVAGGAAGNNKVVGGGGATGDGGGGGGSLTAGTNGSSSAVDGATTGGPGGTGASSVVKNVEYL